jgi:Protein of unknown function (DUF2785)
VDKRDLVVGSAGEWRVPPAAVAPAGATRTPINVLQSPPMTDWRAVIDNDLRLPDGLSLADAVGELSDALRSPDPELRDRLAYTVLARLVPRLDGELRGALGDAMAARFQDPEIQARTFAPLILAALVEQGEFRPSWPAAFEAWYPAETDLRGHDEKLGWLHAVAHGADLLGAFGRCPQVDPASMLRLAAARLLARTDHVLRDQEDDRLAYAMALTATREELTEEQSVDWLDAIAADFEAGEPGPVPAHASNAMRTLRLLYLLADRGVRPSWAEGDPMPFAHRDPVKRRLAEVLSLVAPFAG